MARSAGLAGRRGELREDPRRIGAKRRRDDSTETREPSAAWDGGARKAIAASGTERVSFLEEIRRFSGQVTVRTADGVLRELSPEITVASPGLQSLIEIRDQRTAGGAGRDVVLLRQPDCTAEMLRRVEDSLRSALLPEDLEWPSEEAWSFLRCVAFMGVPALLDAVARKAAKVLVDCLLEPADDAVRGTFGQAPPGGLEGPAVENAVGEAAAAEVRACLGSSRALGVRAAEAAAAALAGVEESPLRGVGTRALLQMLRAADDLVAQSDELRMLEECATELEALSALRAVADARFRGCSAVAAAALRHLAAVDSPELLDQGLAVLEATLEPGNAAASFELASWLQGPRGSSASWEARGQALALLIRVAPPGHQQAADALVAAASNEELGGEGGECDGGTVALAMRQAAIAALPAVAPQGHEEALEAVAAWLLTEEGEAGLVRGLEALERLGAGAGPPLALSAAARCLVDGSERVRQCAVAALGALASPGDEGAQQAARAGRASADAAVRAAAVAALSAVADWGSDEGAVADLCLLLSDPSPEVRDAALAAVSARAVRGLPGVCGALLKLLEHKVWSVRARALAALGRCAAPEDADAARAIAARLEDQALGVREEVPAALELLLGGQRGDRAVVQEVAARLGHAKWSVRQAAAAALARAAPSGDAEAAAQLAVLLRDGMASVREHAVSALARLGAPAAEGLTAGIRAAAAERDPSVRVTAQSAAGKLLARGSPAGVEIAMKGLADACPPVREGAATALGCLADEADVQRAMEALAAKLEDPSDPVRRAAAAALPQLVRSVGQPLTALALAKRSREHPSQAIRRTAEGAFKALEELCLQAGKEPRRSEPQEPAPPASVVKREPRPRAAPADAVAQGLGAFVVGLQSKDDEGLAEKEADPVTRGLENFLAEQRKRVGPICALEAPSGAPPARPPPTPAGASSIFRPPVKEERCVKEEDLAPEPEGSVGPGGATSATPAGRSPSRYSTSRASPGSTRARSRHSASRPSPETSRARSRSPRGASSSLPPEPSPDAEDSGGGASPTSPGGSEAASSSEEGSQEEARTNAEDAAASRAASSASASGEAGRDDTQAGTGAEDSSSSSSEEEEEEEEEEAGQEDTQAGAEAEAACQAATSASEAARSAAEEAGRKEMLRGTADEAASQVPPSATSEAPPGVHLVDLEPSDDD